MGGDYGHPPPPPPPPPPCTRAGQGGGEGRGDLNGKICRPTAAGRSLIKPANAAAAATVAHRMFLFSSHSRPTHTSLPPFLDPLNSFRWSFFTDSSPFERYEENKFGRWLDQVFRPPHHLSDQGNGISVFLVSWAFR